MNLVLHLQGARTSPVKGGGGSHSGRSSVQSAGYIVGLIGELFSNPDLALQQALNSSTCTQRRSQSAMYSWGWWRGTAQGRQGRVHCL